MPAEPFLDIVCVADVERIVSATQDVDRVLHATTMASSGLFGKGRSFDSACHQLLPFDSAFGLAAFDFAQAAPSRAEGLRAFSLAGPRHERTFGSP